MACVDRSMYFGSVAPLGRSRIAPPRPSRGILSKFAGTNFDAKSVFAIILAVVILVLPMDLPTLGLVALGLGAAVAVRASQNPKRRTENRHDRLIKKAAEFSSPPGLHFTAPPSPPAPPKDKTAKTTTVQPVATQTFAAAVFEEQVQELLRQQNPSKPEALRVKQELTACLQKEIGHIVPADSIEVHVYGDTALGTTCSIAVPDIEAVVCIHPRELIEGLKTSGKAQCPILLASLEMDMAKLQKVAVRKIAEQMVKKGGNFKFRRSAFGAAESKVTLVCLTVDRCDQICFDFSVNFGLIVHNAALVNELMEVDLRMKQLVLLVRRWAKDRGVCNAAKGSLAPYAWTLLVVYFLQVATPMLAPFECQKQDHKAIVCKRDLSKQQKSSALSEKATVVEFLRGFFRFYAEEMKWDDEAVCVSFGTRGPPNPQLHKHKMDSGDAVWVQGPSIEDPFLPQSNLAVSLDFKGWDRVQTELCRAFSMTTAGDTLKELLEPWVPEEYSSSSSMLRSEVA